MHSRVLDLLLLLAMVPAGARPLSAQNVGATVAGGPQFFIAASGDARPVRTEPSRVSALRARISVDLTNVTLETALDAISEQSRMRIAYSRALVPLGTRVSLSANDISIAAALTEVLLDTGVDVLISRTGQITLTPRAAEPARLEPGTIVGRVTDAQTGTPIVNAQIAVDGRGRALTDDDGHYRIDGVSPGRRTVSVTSIGHARASREIEVGDGATVTADFALEVSASQLDQIVVTVTGERRVRELGHVVGQINADSLVRAAPISNISELLTGRVAGLQVFQTSGIVGGDVQLQVRTPNTLLLGTQPIVIVDGVRYTNTAARDPAREFGGSDNSIYGRWVSPGPAQGSEVTSPLNDLNPNDIETIEVVKGPTAATLYGTDAANGVIVITTKHGRPGPARWNAYTTASLTESPKNLAVRPEFFAWGHFPNGEPYGYMSGGRFRPSSCLLTEVAIGACVQDSIAAIHNPFTDPDLTLFESAPQWTYGMNVSGGSSNIRYYLAGSFRHETGPIRMPQALVDSIEAARGTDLPDEQLRPNHLSNLNLRSNLSASFGGLQLDGNLGYVRRRNRTLNHDAYVGALSPEPGEPWSSASRSPSEVFSRTSINEVDRFVGGANARWRPLPWLYVRAGAGMDLGVGSTHSLLRRGEAKDFSGNPHPGEVQEEISEQRRTSADIGLTASLVRGRVSSRTSLGAQYARSLNEIRIASGTGLVPGGESVVQADTRSTDRLYSETATLGSYLEHTFGLNDRLFLTGALRIDGASNFGQEYEAAVYPKASASWLISEEPFFPRLPGIDALRLRYAFGASGQQAYTWMKVPTFATPQGIVDGPQTAVIDVTALGSAHLRPERVREHEFGFDVAALDDRVNLELVWYRRRVTDQILSLTLPPGLGSIHTNLGLTTARGFEASLNATVIDSRHLSWHLSFNHSSLSTRVVDLGDAAERVSYLGGYKEGYSLGARFFPRYLGFEDTDGNDVIEYSELLWTDTAEYVGETIPPRTYSLHTMFGFFEQRLRVSASFNRSTGHVRAPSPIPCSGRECRALLDPSTPLEEQARAQAQRYRTQAFNLPADATRLSTVTVRAELPSVLLSPLGLRSGAVSVSARNLALWTDYSGDPASVQVTGIATRLSPRIPRARSWTFRFDLGF